jgi:hypothetical protein
VRQEPALERALAGPRDVGGEVVVTELAQAARHLGVHLRPLAGQDQQLLGASPGGLVEHPLDLRRRV